MSTIIQISGKELAKIVKIPSELENQELEIEIRPVDRKKNRFEKFFKTSIKVDSFVMPSREERNER